MLNILNMALWCSPMVGDRFCCQVDDPAGIISRGAPEVGLGP